MSIIYILTVYVFYSNILLELKKESQYSYLCIILKIESSISQTKHYINKHLRNYFNNLLTINNYFFQQTENLRLY